MITQYDIEYLVIFAILGVLFFKGLKPNMGGAISTIRDRQGYVASIKRNCLCFYPYGTLGTTKV